MSADEPEVPARYVVSISGFDGMELMLNAGRGVQTLIADEEGRIVAAVVPVGAWYPGARVPDGVSVMQAGQWLDDAIDARIQRRNSPGEAPGTEL